MRRLGGELAGALDEHREVGVVDDVDAQPFTRFGEADVGRETAQLGLGLHLAHQRLGELLKLQPLGLPPHRLARAADRSEEHTSELQSLMRNSYAVFCLKKKNNTVSS